jgi:CRP-like cAMP-binding protein
MPRREIPAHELLASVALFKKLDSAARARIAERVTKVRLRRGEAVFERGATPTGFFAVVFGEIALFAHDARGARLTGVVGPGRSFGEPIMFLERPYLVDARAQTDALLLHIPKNAVFAEIERNPAFARHMIAGLAARVESLVREIDTHTRRTAQQRLVTYLLRASRANEGEATVTLATSKAAVATQLGLTAEHFSRILHELARRKLLRVEGRRVIIPDVRALAARAREERTSRRRSGRV